MWFILAVNAACANLTCAQAKLLLTTHAPEEAQVRVQRIVAMIETLDKWVDEVPPEPMARGRFGNKAFRVYQERLGKRVGELMHAIMDGYPAESDEEQRSASNAAANDELAAYLLDAFGNATRIDYGSGHELAFVFFMGGLELLGYFGRDLRSNESQDRAVLAALGLVVMPKYLDLVRKLQRTYSLEPAGSHGVWGLDDFQFLPYLWGSAQLLDHKHIKPGVVTDKEQVSHFAKEYLYLSCIHYIHETKQGPFFEHSPMLFDISGVQFWSKVNGGMTKMFVAEVMSKFPIVQHIKFGSLFPFRRIDDQQ
ncbi:Phosphotyrosyl phosphatase activator [Catenaria anguillulae PL171]|uniref:Serine/threonine-protein phosphatase 2A activator n=1 Tax=Catenaria anguillulae PL171 TaxID=765915 RepID=A0A1Y2HTY5_9FUNG|nr:Phosphotyrosyl phosphatase activator [Catenaria anguillulae PL171]